MNQSERMKLARRIAAHEPPTKVRKVDKELLTKTAKRLQRCADVVAKMPCSPVKN